MIDAGERRRLLMLERMGITVWNRRRSPPVASEPALPAPETPVPPTVARAEAPTPSPAPTPSWESLVRTITACQRCGLARERRQAVPGSGAVPATLMLVGEAPGADEDRSGQPFVGRAGRLLDRMLQAIGRDRAEACFITNTVKCRPPGNRNPETDELAACASYLDDQIRLVQPAAIVALGLIAAQRLLVTREPLHRLRGTVQPHPGSDTPVLVTYHPAYLLRRPADKGRAWADWKVLRRLLDAQAGS